MDIINQIRDFVNKYHTTGWLLLLIAIGLLLQGILALIFPSEGEGITYSAALNYFLLPASGQEFIRQPWSLISYPFFIGSAGTSIFFRLLYDCMLLWVFGRIHQQFLTEKRTKRLVILGIPIIAIISLILCAFLPMPTVAADAENPARAAQNIATLTHMSGMTGVIIMLVVSTIALVPDYTIELLLFGRIKILWAGIIMVVLTTLMISASLPMTVMVLVGAGLGYLHVYLLRKGTDITEIVWSYYQDKEPKPRMKVKYGEGSKPKGKNTTKQPSSPKKTKKGEVSQEIIDKILDKISEKGYNSLSREEKEILFKASNQEDENKK